MKLREAGMAAGYHDESGRWNWCDAKESSRLSKRFRSDLTDLKFKMGKLAGEKEDSIDSGTRWI